MQRWEKELREWINALLLAVIMAVLLRVFVVDNYIVDGDSMLPTLHNQNRVLVSKLGTKLGKMPQRGDIIVFEYAREPWRDFVKRVIGIEGDQIEIKEGKVFVNQRPLSEPYLNAATLGSYGPVTVPSASVFVLGDNRNFSMDSRDPSVGMVSQASIRGRAILIYWPPQAMRIMRR